MQNDAGDVVELYVPRKCSSSGRIIPANDHASVQLDFVEVNAESGVMIPGQVKRYTIAGSIRRMGESDDCILRLAKEDGLIPTQKA